MSKNMKSFISKRYFLATVVSSLLSIFMVAVVAYGATMTISSTGLGSGTSTPGAAVGAQGAGVFEGFVHADYFTSTSSNTSWIMGNFGNGTTTPGAKIAAKGAGLFEGFVHADYFTSTSSATSWVMGQVGIGTTTPGAQLGVNGAGLFEGFVDANYFRSSSTDVSSGFGTTSPGAEFAVAGGVLFDGRVTASSYTATSTTATSTIKWSLDVATSSLQVDGVTGKVAIGTSTLPLAQNIAGIVDPSLTITGVGNTASATGTLYIAGGGANGGQIILKSTDGTRCVSITVTNALTALDAGPGALTTKTVACPR